MSPVQADTQPLLSGPGTVPDMDLDLVGQAFAGAYWNEREYRVTFVLDPDRLDWPHAKVTCETSDGQVVNTFSLDARQLLATLTSLHNAASNVRAPVPGLRCAVIWDVGDERHDVSIGDAHLEEMLEWLRYAANVQVWDGAEQWDY